MVAYPDRGEGNDPEPFFFFFFRGVGSLSQPRLNIFTVDNMGVMICLGQGGLRSLSASSFFIKQSVDTRQGLCLQGHLVVTKNQVKFLEDTMVKDCIAQCLHI